MHWWVIGIVSLIVGTPSVQAEQPQVEVVKMPVQVGTRYFDPKRPPPDRPPLTGRDEAVCAGDFLSDASVGSQAQMTDATHAKATINKIKVTLQLNITIWLPNNPQKWTTKKDTGRFRSITIGTPKWWPVGLQHPTLEKLLMSAATTCAEL